MRHVFPMLAAIAAMAALPVHAQHAAPADQTILYGVRKNQPPQGVVIEQGVANPGIPTSGTQQAQQLKKQPSGYGGGPNVIYRDHRERGLTVITGPDGTTVCRDASGRVTVCY